MLRGKSLTPIVIKIRKTRRKESFAEMMFLFATRRLLLNYQLLCWALLETAESKSKKNIWFLKPGFPCGWCWRCCCTFWDRLATDQHWNHRQCQFLLDLFYRRGRVYKRKFCLCGCLSVITFSFYEYSIIWWSRPCKPYIFWKLVMLATSTALFWPSTTEYQPLPPSTDPVFNDLMV